MIFHELFFSCKIHYLDYRNLLYGDTNSCPKDESIDGLKLTACRLGLRLESRVLSELSPNTQINHIYVVFSFLFLQRKNTVAPRRSLGIRLHLLGATITVDYESKIRIY